MTTADTRVLVGYADPAGQGLGFLLPLFSRHKHNALEVEIWGADGIVDGFAVTPFEGQMLDPPQRPTESRIGGDAHWAFGVGGEILHGAGAEGQDALARRLDAGELDTYPLLALEVAEFLERSAERLQRAKAAHDSLRARSPEAADRWRDINIQTPDFRARLQEKLGPELIARLAPVMARVVVNVQGSLLKVSGIDVQEGAKVAKPIGDTLLGTVQELALLYGERKWQVAFRRERLASSPPPWPGHALGRLFAMVQVADQKPRLQRVSEPRSAVDGIGLYGPEDVRVFSEQAREFHGSTFALYALDPEAAPVFPEERFGLLGLATRTRATARLHPAERAALEASGLVTVIVPSRDQAAGQMRVGLSGELRDAVQFLSDPSRELQSRFRAKNYVFMRANGTGPRPIDDAWAQVYGRLWKLGMTGALGFKYPSERSFQIDMVEPDEAEAWPPRALGIGEELFPQMDDVHVHREELWRLQGFNVAVLAEAEESTDNVIGRRHAQVVDTVLRLQGWQANRSDSFFGVSSDGYRGVNGSIEVDFTGSKLRTNDYNPMDRIHVDALQNAKPLRILAHEEAGPAAILGHIQQYGAVPATLRDLSYFPAHIGGVWPLLASQMRRFCVSLPARSRSQYFGMFVQAALDAGRVQMIPQLASDIAADMHPRILGYQTHLFCSGVSYGATRAVASMRLVPDRRLGGSNYRFRLVIDSDGPWLLN